MSGTPSEEGRGDAEGNAHQRAGNEVEGADRVHAGVAGFVWVHAHAHGAEPGAAEFSRSASAAVTGVWLKAHTGNGLKVTRKIAQSRPRPAASASASQSLRAKTRANPALPSNACAAETDPALASSAASHPALPTAPTW